MARRLRDNSSQGAVADLAAKRAQVFVNKAIGMYREGWFPMGEEDDDLSARWVAPRLRGTLALDERFHISKSLSRAITKHKFDIVTDADFAQVVQGCGLPRRKDTGRWINSYVCSTMMLMHEFGHAHSIEARLPGSGDLVGGVYGVMFGAVFCAESMFCLPEHGGTDASKVCLVGLVALLSELGFKHLDIQMLNEHTARFGGFEIPHERFLEIAAELQDSGTTAWPRSGTDITQLTLARARMRSKSPST